VVTLLCAPGQPKGSGRVCTATVTPPSGGHAGRPTGSVSFTASPSGPGNFSKASCTLPATGAKQCSTTFSGATAGTYRILATYNGNQTYLMRSAHYTISVK
jgi:hypothetical protein